MKPNTITITPARIRLAPFKWGIDDTVQIETSDHSYFAEVTPLLSGRTQWGITRHQPARWAYDCGQDILLERAQSETILGYAKSEVIARSRCRREILKRERTGNRWPRSVPVGTPK